MTVRLRGTTWAHTRGYAPLAATARAWSDFHPEVEIVWEQRSLWAFGEAPLEPLAREYDLVVFDHPFTGHAASLGLFLPLDEHLPAAVLADIQRGSTGPSFESYACGGHQWGLPIDAAAQVAVSRPDLLERLDRPPPRTWNEVLVLARDTGAVGMAFTPMGTWGAFLSLCATGGEPALRHRERVVSREAGEAALEGLAALFALVGPASLESSPIRVLGRMAATDEVAYAPMLYGYSNHARDGYAPRRLAYHDIPAGGRGGANLGGAGLAVSAFSKNRAEALEYAAWVCGGECQRTLYALAGGQPGHRAAWEDEVVNRATHNFFRDTLPTLERAYLRPNFAGFTGFQTEAGELLHAFLKGEVAAAETLAALNRAWTGLRPAGEERHRFARANRI